MQILVKGNESAPCAAGQRGCLCSFAAEEGKEPPHTRTHTPIYVQLLLRSGAAGHVILIFRFQVVSLEVLTVEKYNV